MTESIILAGVVLGMIGFSIWYSNHSYVYADVIYKDGTNEEVGPFKSESEFQSWFYHNQNSIQWFKEEYRFHLKSPYDKQTGS